MTKTPIRASGAGRACLPPGRIWQELQNNSRNSRKFEPAKPGKREALRQPERHIRRRLTPFH